MLLFYLDVVGVEVRGEQAAEASATFLVLFQRRLSP